MNRLAFILLLLVSIQTTFAQTKECDVELKAISKESLKELKSPYFKRYSYYTRETSNDPTSDTLFFMILNFHIGNKLTWAQYLTLQKRMDKVPGENSYSAPTLDILLPYMLRYLKEIGYKTTISQEIIDLTKEDYQRINTKIFPEIIGGNRVSYRILQSDKQMVVKDEGNGSYLVRTIDCPGQLYRFDMSDYERFENFDEEIQLLTERLEVKNTKEILTYMKDSLSPQAYFYMKLKDFLAAH